MARFSGSAAGGGGTVSLLTSTDSSVVITNPGGPTVDLSVTPASIGALALTGGTMAGDIDMDENSVVNERLVQVTFAATTTTTTLGLADEYIATAPAPAGAGITLTISSADIVDGREFAIRATGAGTNGSSPVTIVGEGGELIDGAASITLEAQFASVVLSARGGNLESTQ